MKAKYLLIILLLTISVQAQIEFGLPKVYLQGGISVASPKKELANYYHDGDILKFYIEANAPFMQINYGKKLLMGLNVAAIVGHENANFLSNNYVDELPPLDVKITYYGLKLKPFQTKVFNIASGTEGKTASDWSVEDRERGYAIDENGNMRRLNIKDDNAIFIQFLKNLLSEGYIEFGSSSANLIESGTPDVKRNPTFFGFGLAPRKKFGQNMNLILDIGVRNYNWTNASTTISSINMFRAGIAFKINL